MEAAAHDPGFAAKAKIPVSVAQEFVRADQRLNPLARGYVRAQIKKASRG